VSHCSWDSVCCMVSYTVQSQLLAHPHQRHVCFLCCNLQLLRHRLPRQLCLCHQNAGMCLALLGFNLTYQLKVVLHSCITVGVDSWCSSGIIHATIVESTRVHAEASCQWLMDPPGAVQVVYQAGSLQLQVPLFKGITTSAAVGNTAEFQWRLHPRLYGSVKDPVSQHNDAHRGAC
jgi:hypothetical protein